MTKSLLPHQADALNAVINQFKTHDRAHVVMACGTGKTFAALKIAEQLSLQTMIVFLPSLALINQFMREWMADTSMELIKVLTVCSDDTVARGIEVNSIIYEKLKFPVTVDIRRIRKFVSESSIATKIVFCTYHSSHLLAEAAFGHTFDFALFDEAHKTAGIDKKFSCALHDEFIKINKRLFMTATPKHAHSTLKDENGNQAIIYSMDDESIYGPRCYTLGFRDAINQGLICDYKIIISVADGVSEKDLFKDNIYSGAVALEKAIQSSNAKRVITYHGSIEKAKTFCEHIKAARGLRDFHIEHINGEMSIGKRNKVMKKFRESGKAIITNSRCLTEGVDVPSVDMVAFLNPRSSTIDIVQAIGRALRKSPGKQKGYVFLPIFLNSQVKDADNAIQGSDFSHIWDVLNVLSEQDTDLNDVIKKIGKRRGDNWSNKEDKNLESYISIDSRIDVNFLQSIQARILDQISGAFDKRYKELCEYKKKHGTTRVVPSDEHKSLGLWVKKQRALQNEGNLQPERKALLDSIGFVWNVQANSWDTMYEELISFKSKNGHVGIPKLKNDENLYKLSRWVREQQRSYASKKLDSKKITKLKALGVEFKEKEPTKNWFDDGYKRIVKYLEVKELKKFPNDGISFRDNRSLRYFVEELRKKKKAKELSETQIKVIEELNFKWAPQNSKFVRRGIKS